jgi:hypothetical protein
MENVDVVGGLITAWKLTKSRVVHEWQLLKHLHCHCSTWNYLTT